MANTMSMQEDSMVQNGATTNQDPQSKHPELEPIKEDKEELE